MILKYATRHVLDAIINKNSSIILAVTKEEHI